MLELTGVHSHYGASHILHGVDLHVGEGEIVALLGRNGVGKTTTIRAISGSTPPSAGSVRLAATELAGTAPHRIARAGVAVVPQGRRIFRSLSVQENLKLAARTADGRTHWNLARIYELFPILQERRSVPGTLLSGGEQQMLAIGRALMTNPRVLLMDEPSEGLAPIVIDDIARVIKELGDGSLSILVVEQNLALALDVASRAYILSKGHVVYEGSVADLSQDADTQARHLGATGHDHDHDDQRPAAPVNSTGGPDGR